jgi:hypothetical protein
MSLRTGRRGNRAVKLIGRQRFPCLCLMRDERYLVWAKSPPQVESFDDSDRVVLNPVPVQIDT